MNTIQRIRAKTPRRNKISGRVFTSISGAVIALQVALMAENVTIPKWLHVVFITTSILSATIAGYHAQKVKK